MGSAVRFFGNDFVEDLLQRAANVPGRKERWEWAISKSLQAASPSIHSLEDAINLFNSSGRLKNAGHSEDIVKKVYVGASKR